MSEFFATVYDPPAAGQPYVAVIVGKGKVIFAQAVVSVAEGEKLLKQMLKGIANLVKEDGHI